MAATCWPMRPTACQILCLKVKSEGALSHFWMFMFRFVLFCSTNFVTCKTSFWKNLNGSARTDRSFSTESFPLNSAPTQQFSSRIDPLERNFHTESLQNIFSTECFSLEVFLLRSLPTGALLLSSLFEFSQRDIFRGTTAKLLGKDS